MGEGSSARRWRVLEHLFKIGWGVILATGLIAFSRDRFASLWPPPPVLCPEYLSRVLGVVLLTTIVALIFRWIFAVSGEMRLLKDYFEEFIPTQTGHVYLWTALFSVLLGTLGYYSDRTMIFCGIFAVYSLGDLWGQKIRDCQLRNVLRKTQAVEYTQDPRKQGWQAIEQFYLVRPQLQRSVTVMFVTFTAMLLAEAAALKPDNNIAPWLECGALVLVVVNIIVSEVVIYRWRKTLNAQLDENYTF